ncbi:MAG TPA: hypothetical protein VG028_19025 [Terriglobia bacterium]|nr:hypothetical protein [Terriglobia bacterium]
METKVTLKWEQFLEETAAKGEVLNLMFEERLFNLVGILEKIAEPLTTANIPYEIIGGLAVLIHVEAANPSQSILTRDVDILICRPDLDRVIAAAEAGGFQYRHAAGVDMLLYGGKTGNPVHVLFTGEKVKPNQTVPHPQIAPELKEVKGQSVCVIPVAELVRMKLSANRDKDRVHIRSLDAAGLITPEIEHGLPEPLMARLQQVRETE